MQAGDDSKVQLRQERLELLQEDLERQAENRKKFSRRRTFNGEEEVNYINERNRKYNLKLKRYFGKYTQEIKSNLENGTALNN